MLSYKVAIAMLSLSCLHCGAPDETAPVAPPPQGASGLVRIAGQSGCGGTLIAPDAVLTSALCAFGAEGLRYEFVPQGAAYDARHSHLVREAVLHPQFVVPCSSSDTPQHQTACSAIFRQCDLAALSAQDANAMTCLRTVPIALLQDAGLAGMSDLHDLAILFLETPDQGAVPATLAAPEEPETLLPKRSLQYAARALPDPVIVETESAALSDSSAVELLFAPMSPPCDALLGGAVWSPNRALNTDAGLLGVISRSSVLAGTCTEGLVVTRVDTERAWIDAALRDACSRGARFDCSDGGGLPEMPPSPSAQGCAAGQTGPWIWAALLVAFLRPWRHGGKSLQAAPLLLMVLPGCGDVLQSMAPSASDTQAIIDGTPAPNRFVDTGALVLAGKMHCTGVLIAPDIVLTAGHCVSDGAGAPTYAEPLRLEFVHAPHARLVGRKTSALVRHIAVHPQYSLETCAPRQDMSPERQAACDEVQATCGEAASGQAFQACLQSLPGPLLRAMGLWGLGTVHDVALLFLDQPVKGIQPARLLQAAQQHRLQMGTPLWHVGFGQRVPDPGSASEAYGERYAAVNEVADIDAWEFQLGNAPPQGCFGDSGGPAFVELEDGPMGPGGLFVAGVASRMTQSFRCEGGLTYSRVDAELPWIDETLRSACDKRWRATCRGVTTRVVQLPAPLPRRATGCAAVPSCWGVFACLWAARRALRRRQLELR